MQVSLSWWMNTHTCYTYTLHIHTMEYHSAIKMRFWYMLQFGWTLTPSQTRKDKDCMISLIWSISNKQIYNNRKYIWDDHVPEGEENGELLLNGSRVSVWGDKKFWKQWWWLHNIMDVMLLNGTINNGSSGKFLLCRFHPKKNKRKKKQGAKEST